MTDPGKTHRDLLPDDLCPYLVMKQTLTHGLDDPVDDGRDFPGDGYYWCQLSCHDIGPDDEVVDPSTCRQGRACYASPAS